MASGPNTSWEIDRETMETGTDFIFLGSKITADGDFSHKIKRHLLLGRNADQPGQRIKKQRHYSVDKGPSSQSSGFSNCHVWIWELDNKEGWVPMNWCFWTVVLENTLESPLDGQEIQPVSPKGSQSWIVNGRTDAETEAPILWPPDGKSQLVGKTLMLGKTEGRRRRGRQRMRWWDGITGSMDIWAISGRQWRTGKPSVLQGVSKSWTWLRDWTATI